MSSSDFRGVTFVIPVAVTGFDGFSRAFAARIATKMTRAISPNSVDEGHPAVLLQCSIYDRGSKKHGYERNSRPQGDHADIAT